MGAALVCTGCASVVAPLAHLTTARAVGQSFTNLFDQPGVSIEMSVGVDATQLAQLRTLLDHGAVAALSPSEAAALAAVPSTSLRLSLHSADGGPLSAGLGAKSTGGRIDEDLAVDVRGDEPVELRTIGTTIYGRLDLPGLYAEFGQDPAAATGADQVIEGLAARVRGLAPLAHGRWVSADLRTLQAQAPPGTDTAPPHAVLGNLETSLRDAFKDNASFRNSGTHSGRTEYTITLGVAGFVRQLYDSLESALGSEPFGPELKLLAGPIDRIPASTRVVVQEWVKDDRAEEIDLDLAQFDHSVPFPVPLRIVIGSAPTITAPSGASSVDLAQLLPLLQPLSGGAPVS